VHNHVRIILELGNHEPKRPEHTIILTYQ
jgi:hypothetical protein